MKTTLRITPTNTGFTVIELLVSIAFLLTAGIVAAWQFNTLQTSLRDDSRKIAINSMYYGLEEVFYKEHNYYPQEITDETLRSVDDDLLKDPEGVAIGDPASDYRYEATDCTQNKCQSYTLRADLENESDYIKTNRTNN